MSRDEGDDEVVVDDESREAKLRHPLLVLQEMKRMNIFCHFQCGQSTPYPEHFNQSGGRSGLAKSPYICIYICGEKVVITRENDE